MDEEAGTIVGIVLGLYTFVGAAIYFGNMPPDLFFAAMLGGCVSGGANGMIGFAVFTMPIIAILLMSGLPA